MQMHDDFLFLVQSAAKRQRGGITALAHTMQVSEVVLANKLNPNYERNHLSADELAQIVELTRDVRIVNELARLAGCAAVPMNAPMPQCGEGLLNHFAALVAVQGLVADQIRKATDTSSELGEKLSCRERQDIGAVLDDLIQTAWTLRLRLEK